MKLKVAMIYIRSITAIVTTGAVIAYLGLRDPQIIGVWIGGITAWVVFEKKTMEE